MKISKAKKLFYNGHRYQLVNIKARLSGDISTLCWLLDREDYRFETKMVRSLYVRER